MHLLKAATGVELLRTQQLLARTEELLAQIMVVPLDEAAADQFERLRMVKSLRKIGRADLLIASIALANRAALVTRNLRHFQPNHSLDSIKTYDGISCIIGIGFNP